MYLYWDRKIANFLYIYLFYSIFIRVFLLHICMWITYIFGTEGSAKRASHILVLYLWMTVSCDYGQLKPTLLQEKKRTNFWEISSCPRNIQSYLHINSVSSSKSLYYDYNKQLVMVGKAVVLEVNSTEPLCHSPSPIFFDEHKYFHISLNVPGE